MSTPLDGAATPAVAREFRMFSTEVAVREQPDHALLKQLFATLTGLQLSNTLAGKFAKEEQPYHEYSKLCPKFRSVTRKEVRAVQFIHA